VGFEYTEAGTVVKWEDGDDQVVYTWAVPGTENKQKREDGDNQVIYTWAVPNGAS
jgi:hypothetical protein